MMSKVRSLVDALREVRVQRDRIADLERELVRISPQLAALEQRVEDLRTRLDDPTYAADQADTAEARSLVEEVRTEHARVRARISAATVFEERLRVLEKHLGIDSATGRPAETT
jgi:predicted  nucleic acid-binding Zn-ribbon protein